VERQKERTSFPLRLAVSLRDRAQLLAAQDGVSLNHFISLAVAEKVSRLEAAQEESTHKRRTTG
jgi:predicted HicB family RNase H-like nuclease